MKKAFLLSLLLTFVTSINAKESGFASSKLLIDQKLTVNQWIESPNKLHRFYLQRSGNLILQSTKINRVYWTSRTQNRYGTRLVLQSDGNLVLYKTSGAAVWSSRTVGTGASRLAINNDGSLALYRGNTPVWSRNGSGVINDPAKYGLTNVTDQAEHGSIQPTSVVVSKGDSQTFTVVPDNGYHLKALYIDNRSVGARNSYTFNNVKKSHEIFAVFELNKRSNSYFDYQGFTRVINDEFAFFDANLWTRDWNSFEHNIVWFNGPNNFEYVANEKGLSKMKIHIREEPGDWGRGFTSGQIISRKEYSYGRYEARMKCPPGSGYAATLFTFNTWNEDAAWEEIDLEIEGQFHDRLTTNLFTGGNTIAQRKQYHVVAPLNSYPNRPSFDTHNWNIFSFDWLPNKVIYYVNGQEIRRENRHVNESNFHPAKIFMSFWLSDEGIRFAGPNDGNVYPMTLEYDYFRYYQLDDDTSSQAVPVVSFSDVSVKQVNNVGVTVAATSRKSKITKVELFINGIFVREEKYSPYDWGLASSVKDSELLNLVPGVYQLEAIATDENSISTSTISKFTIEDETVAKSQVCFYDAKNYSGKAYCYKAGDTVFDLRSNGLSNLFSSVKVPNGFNVQVCDYTRLSGCTIIRSSISDLSATRFSNGDIANNDITSFRILN